MADNIIIPCLYDFRVHCDYYNACVITNYKEKCSNRLCQFNSFMKRHTTMLLFKPKKK